jgi:hypothetical protein
MPRELRSYRLDPATIKAVGDAADATGLTQTEVIERILRKTFRLVPDPDVLDTYLDMLAARGAE